MTEAARRQATEYAQAANQNAGDDGLPAEIVGALARGYHDGWLAAQAAAVPAIDAVRALLPAECWVSRSSEVRCIDFVGGTFDNGAEFTEAMACLPCRVRRVLEVRA